MFGSLFRTFGAKVCFALGADNDATIAAHAHANDAAILEAQENKAELERQQGCRKKLLSSLQRVTSAGSNSEAEEMHDQDDE